MPGGNGMPAVSLPIFSWLTSSARRTPSLKAAATRSSSMSLSSPSRLGSMAMRLTSCLQVIVTLTRPAPDWPSTSIVASSSCAFFRLSCIACACFIKPASWPFIMSSLLVVGARARCSMRFHRARHDARGLVLCHQRLDQRIVVDDALGFGLAPIALGAVARGGGVDGSAGLDLEAHRTPFGLRDGRLQTLAQRRGAQVLALDAQ